MSSAKLVRAFGYAAAGLRRAYAEQQNFRIELMVAAAAVLVALWTGAALSPVLLAAGLVLGLELVNSAVEAVVDRLAPGHHDAAAAAKDLAAGAVLLAALTAASVGLVVLAPPLVRKLTAVLGGG